MSEQHSAKTKLVSVDIACGQLPPWNAEWDRTLGWHIPPTGRPCAHHWMRRDKFEAATCTKCGAMKYE